MSKLLAPPSFDLNDLMVCALCHTIIIRTDVCQSCGDYDYSVRLYQYLEDARPEIRDVIERNASV